MGLTTARYWREVPQRYRMEAGKCTACGEVHFPPRRVCMKCGKQEFETVVLPDTGTVETYTVIRVAPDEFTEIPLKGWQRTGQVDGCLRGARYPW